MLGVALATGMCFTGLGAAMNSIKFFDRAGLGHEGRAFSLLSVTSIGLFAVLFAIAIVKAKKPEVHKRLLLVATASLLQAAVGRWFMLLFAPVQAAAASGPMPPPPMFVTVPPGLIADLLIVAGMIYDRRSRGQVHPVYWIAGASVLAVQLLRVPLSGTNTWMQIANWFVMFSP